MVENQDFHSYECKFCKVLCSIVVHFMVVLKGIEQLIFSDFYTIFRDLQQHPNITHLS